jgi:hypothetical protein
VFTSISPGCQGFDHQRDAVLCGERAKLLEQVDVLLEPGGDRKTGWNHASAGAAEDDDRHADFARAAEDRGGVAIEAGVVEVGTAGLESGWQQHIGGWHRKSAAAQGARVRSEGRIRRLRHHEIDHVPLDEIAVWAERQGGERGGVSAESELHGAEGQAVAC